MLQNGGIVKSDFSSIAQRQEANFWPINSLSILEGSALIALMSWRGAVAMEIGPGALTMNLDESDGLCAVSMENHLAHRTLNLGRGTELEAVLDPARRSIG